MSAILSHGEVSRRRQHILIGFAAGADVREQLTTSMDILRHLVRSDNHVSSFEASDLAGRLIVETFR